MSGYVTRRLTQALAVLALTSILAFGIINLVPGDPATFLAGPDATPAQIDALRAEMGLTLTPPERYARWLGGLLRGDLGKSIVNGFPVAELLGRALPITLQLTLVALVLSLAVAVPLGILLAVRPEWLISRLLNVYVGLAMATPSFWLGIILVLIFSLQLRLLPTSGFASFFERPLDAVRLLVLPAVTLATYVSAVLARFLQEGLSEALQRDYVRTARAKGLREHDVRLRHALRNALLPFVTTAGLQFGTFMAGAVVTETIFAIPGIGRTLLNATLARDYPVVQAGILLVAAMFVVINLATDLAYARLDPRIRYR